MSDTGSLVTVERGRRVHEHCGDREHDGRDDDLDEQRPPEPAHVAVEVGRLVILVVVVATGVAVVGGIGQ